MFKHCEESSRTIYQMDSSSTFSRDWTSYSVVLVSVVLQPKVDALLGSEMYCYYGFRRSHYELPDLLDDGWGIRPIVSRLVTHQICLGPNLQMCSIFSKLIVLLSACLHELNPNACVESMSTTGLTKNETRLNASSLTARYSVLWIMPWIQA